MGAEALPPLLLVGCGKMGGAMLAGWLDPALSFVLGVSVLLPMNFNSAKLQIDRMKAHAPNALMMASVISRT